MLMPASGLAAPPPGPIRRVAYLGTPDAGRPAAARPGGGRRRRRTGRVAARSAARSRERPGAVAGEGRRPRARPARHRSRRRRARRRRAPRRRGRLRAAHQAARPRSACRWSTCTSRCCPGGAARRRWSGRSSPATRRTGVDLMAVEEGLDTGGTYRRTELPIGPDDTLEELRGAPGGGGHPAPGGGAPGGHRRGRRPRSGEPTYADKLTAEDRHLDWSGPALDVHRRVRLGDAWTTHRGKRLKVWRTHVPPVGDGPRVRAGRRRGRARRGPARGQGPDGRQGVGQRRPVRHPGDPLGT